MLVLSNLTNGFFVDLASNHALLFSNTYRLEQSFHWNGLCIEANPLYVWGLSARKCTTVYAVVGNVTGAQQLFNMEGVYGGLVGQQFDNQIKRRHSQSFYTITLEAILRKFNAPTTIDYLSLDVEGAEEFILGNFPFNRYSFNTMTVERPSPNLHHILAINGYVFIRMLGAHGDSFYMHKQHPRCNGALALYGINNHTYSRWQYLVSPKSCK